MPKVGGWVVQGKKTKIMHDWLSSLDEKTSVLYDLAHETKN